MTSLTRLSLPNLPSISHLSPTSSAESVTASLIDLGELYLTGGDGCQSDDDGWDSNGLNPCGSGGLGGCLKHSVCDSLSEDDDPPVVEGNPEQINFIANRPTFTTPTTQHTFHKCYHGCGCIYDESEVVAMVEDILHPVYYCGVFDYLFDE